MIEILAFSIFDGSRVHNDTQNGKRHCTASQWMSHSPHPILYPQKSSSRPDENAIHVPSFSSSSASALEIQVSSNPNLNHSTPPRPTFWNVLSSWYSTKKETCLSASPSLYIEWLFTLDLESRLETAVTIFFYSNPYQSSDAFHSQTCRLKTTYCDSIWMTGSRCSSLFFICIVFIINPRVANEIKVKFLSFFVSHSHSVFPFRVY